MDYMRDSTSKALALRACTVMLAGLAACAPAFAQDSVSLNTDAGNGLPGDAMSAWGFGVPQRSSYVVDMATLHTSTGTTFGIAPIMKSGNGVGEIHSIAIDATSQSDTSIIAKSILGIRRK